MEYTYTKNTVSFKQTKETLKHNKSVNSFHFSCLALFSNKTFNI